MESFWGSVELMLFTYALAAVISFFVAWIIRLVFSGIQKQKSRAEARSNARARASLEPGDAAP